MFLCFAHSLYQLNNSITWECECHDRTSIQRVRHEIIGVKPPLSKKIIYPFQTQNFCSATDGALNIAAKIEFWLAFSSNIQYKCLASIWQHLQIFVPQYIPFPESAFLAKLHSSLPSKWHDFRGKKFLRDLLFHLNLKPLSIHKWLQRHCVMYLGTSGADNYHIATNLNLWQILTNKILQKFIHWEQLLHARKLVLITGQRTCAAKINRWSYKHKCSPFVTIKD